MLNKSIINFLKNVWSQTFEWWCTYLYNFPYCFCTKTEINLFDKYLNYHVNMKHFKYCKFFQTASITLMHFSLAQLGARPPEHKPFSGQLRGSEQCLFLPVFAGTARETEKKKFSLKKRWRSVYISPNHQLDSLATVEDNYEEVPWYITSDSFQELKADRGISKGIVVSGLERDRLFVREKWKFLKHVFI